MLFRLRHPYRDSGVGQRGAALIVALLVVAVVSLLVTSVAGDSLVTFRRVENRLDSQQAYAYLLAAEGVVRRVLLEDLRIDRKVGQTDSDTEQWAAEGLEYATEHGVIRGRLSDLSGRLHLANLGRGASRESRYSLDQRRFIRLLQAIDLEQPLDQLAAEQLANAVFDWIDDDDRERIPGGAESYYYAAVEPAGRAANRVPVSVSELRRVRGMSAEIYEALEPHLSAAQGADGRININTATLEVLRTLNRDRNLQPLLMEDAERIIEWRQSEGALSDLSLFNGQQLQTKNINTRGLKFNSEHFLLTAETEYLSRQFRLASLIHRSAAKGSVIAVARSRTGRL